MKFSIKPAVALILLMFAGATFAQDEETDQGGSWYDGITSFFSNLFSTGDASDSDPVSPGAEPGAMEWYAGGQAHVTKYEENSLRVAKGFGANAGGIFGNRMGFDLGYFDLGSADVKGAPGAKVKVDGYRGMLTFNTEAGDAPVRLGVGYYSLSADVSGASKSSSGISLGVKFEQAVTDHLYLTLGTDLFLGAKLGAEKTDAIVFGIGLSFHSARPLPAEAEDAAGIEVSEPVAEEPAQMTEPVAEEPAQVTEPEAAPEEAPDDSTPTEEPPADAMPPEEPAN